MSSQRESCSCPICFKEFSEKEIEHHVNKCLFLNSLKECSPSGKRLAEQNSSQCAKRSYVSCSQASSNFVENLPEPKVCNVTAPDVCLNTHTSVPLAEQMRPNDLTSYIGQNHILGPSKPLRILLETGSIPNMILWGPPGCGKTSLAHVIANMCKSNNKFRFAKLSATMDGIDKVKEVVKVARNELSSFKRRTLLFVDEIHRFNKLQQDVFLPHVESGIITLIGATVENPSFRLNNSLLSRCNVYVMEKHVTEDLIQIVKHAFASVGIGVGRPSDDYKNNSQLWATVDEDSVCWIAEKCDGDARRSLNSVQLVHSLMKQKKEEASNCKIVTLSLDEIKECIKRSHIMYDTNGDEHYTIISALHKSIRASDDNAALYWLTRMIAGGEDPIFIARRLVRAASEDIGLADPSALPLAVSTMHGCQLLGMPECDVLLAQCTVYLARAPKSTEAYEALGRAKALIESHKGAQPSVPLHLRNASSKLMKNMGYGKGYNTLHKNISNLQYMPEGMENVTFF